MRQLDASEREVLTDAAVEAMGEYKEKLGLSAERIILRWSNQLTSAAGNVAFDLRRCCYLVKLSYPIFKGVLLRYNWNIADVSVRETVAHELSHISGGTQCRNHDAEWVRRMKLCGCRPTVRHNYAAGSALFGAEDWHAGQEVEFEYKGDRYSGVIVKKNRKRAKVKLGDSTVWNVPYSCLE